MIEFPKFIFIDDSTIVRKNVSNTIRSEMETGAEKTRPRQKTPLFNYEFGVAIPVSRLTEFRNWFIDDIASGNFWFLLRDPLDGVTRKFRFLDTEIEWMKSGNLLRSSFTLESYDEL